MSIIFKYIKALRVSHSLRRNRIQKEKIRRNIVFSPSSVFVSCGLINLTVCRRKLRTYALGCRKNRVG